MAGWPKFPSSSPNDLPPAYSELYPSLSRSINDAAPDDNLDQVCQICHQPIHGAEAKCTVCFLTLHSTCLERINNFVVDVDLRTWKCKKCTKTTNRVDDIEVRMLKIQNEHLMKEKQSLERIVAKLEKRIHNLKAHNGRQETEEDHHWVNFSTLGSALPKNIVQGGVDVDRHPIYVGRAHYSGDLLPAKVIPGKKAAYVAYDGKERQVYNLEVLCAKNSSWLLSHGGYTRPGALKGGYTSSGESLYIGRVRHKGSLTVGKIHPSHHVCYIPFDGKEIAYSEYEVLVLQA
ncbi:hypothetical protein Zmor_027330 [Zophobas morio]|uniref:Uncharacterized protein n=1 Tax=Zophobas morio TaxID=2755281 RepID=A0AA38HP41_9CUCU|nr:hypothetical protein Zmor_027330 [Zophobas morio]